MSHITYANGWFPDVYMSYRSQNFCLFHVSNLSVLNFRFFLLLYPRSMFPMTVAWCLCRPRSYLSETPGRSWSGPCGWPGGSGRPHSGATTTTPTARPTSRTSRAALRPSARITTGGLCSVPVVAACCRSWEDNSGSRITIFCSSVFQARYRAVRLIRADGDFEPNVLIVRLEASMS